MRNNELKRVGPDLGPTGMTGERCAAYRHAKKFGVKSV